MQWSCMQEREVSAQYTRAERKECLTSPSSEGQKPLGEPNALFSSEQGTLIRSSVFRNANPSNLTHLARRCRRRRRGRTVTCGTTTPDCQRISSAVTPNNTKSAS